MDFGTPASPKLCKRYDQEGHAHYLTFSCWDGLPLLSKDRSREWLIQAVDKARLWHPFDLWAYVLMPQHVHLLILPHPGVRISSILKSIKDPVSKRAMAWLRREHPSFLAKLEDRQPSGRCCYRFWEPGGGFDRNIWSVQELHEKIIYIHNNPVRQNLVKTPEDWFWSSSRGWQLGIDEPLRLDRESLPPIQR